MKQILSISILGMDFSLYFLLLVAGFVIACAGVDAAAERAGVKSLGAILYSLLSAVLAVVLGRIVYCAVRFDWLFYDELGEFTGLWPLIDPKAGSLNVIGVLLGCLLAAPIAGAITKQKASSYLHCAAIPGVFLFAFARLIEPLSGQGYGEMLSNEKFCFFPLALENGMGEYALSVCFIEAVLALIVGIVLLFLRSRYEKPVSLGLAALTLLAVSQIVPESLRRDDVLYLFIFARVTQIGYAVILAGSLFAALAMGIKRGLGKGRAFAEALLMLLGIAACVGGEFALDKTNLPNLVVYLAMIAVLIGLALLNLGRIRKEDRAE